MSSLFNQNLFSIILFYNVLIIILAFSPCKVASTFIHYNCSNNNMFSPNSTYQINLNTLLSSLSSKAFSSTTPSFYNTTTSGTNTSDTVYGLFMCSGYIELCGECVLNSTKILASKCTFNKEAIIWSDECMVRYSNHIFFNTMEENPSWCMKNNDDYHGPLNTFNEVLRSLMEDLLTHASGAPIGFNKFAAEKVTISDSDEKLFGIAQCTPNLSEEYCKKCLRDAMVYLQTSCARSKIGGRVLYPSCVVRYEPYRFFPPRFLLPRGRKRKVGDASSLVIFLLILAVMILSFAYYLLRRKARKSIKHLKENCNVELQNIYTSSNLSLFFKFIEFFFNIFLWVYIVGKDITSEMKSLQFDLSTIEVATNKFSDDNKIGQGGFGTVYKGMLPNGHEIAVKRLTKNSSQGGVEFKNEVSIIAKLQHRNLVRLLGFCMEGKEKILIYEFAQNKSLDYYLFSPENNRKLTWPERYKIIRGIARGILYLHEDSHLKIIHCDLKPSNILLDSGMNAKISDFGLARNVAIDQMQGNTSIIAGTYGYMSPEYAMLGQFSVKSDVFSFGVIILEIVSGKRNVDFHGVNSVDDLLSHAWKNWRDNKPLELLDPTLAPTLFEAEIIRCIKIGLLCVQENPDKRPTMATIAMYFNCYSVDLPIPLEPAFFMRGKKESRVPKKELVSGRRCYSVALSVDEKSMRKFLTRC